MSIDRRTFVGALGAAIPASMASSCAFAGESAWPGPDTPAGRLPKMPIGMNLSSVAGYEPGFPFRNLMWGAAEWMTRNGFGQSPWDTGQAGYFEYDPEGYPLEVPLQTPKSGGVPQYLVATLPNVLTPGEYVLYHDGEGSFDGLQATKIIAEAPGRITLHMRHQAGEPEGLIIRRSKRGNHLRNMRLVAKGTNPDDLASNPFRPEFLDFCKPFRTLRFMDWAATNGSLEDEWNRRRRPGFYTMIGSAGDADRFWGAGVSPFRFMYAGGVAHEIIIQLANLLHIDPWICIPHRASDDYIRQCAALYHRKLDPGLKLYLEYSNEVWNWGFYQAQWMLRSELAGELVARKGLNPWENKDGKRTGILFPQRMGALASRTFRLWLEAWPASDHHRVKRICAVQAGWAAPALETIDWCKDDGHVTAVAAAGYFSATDAVMDSWEKAGAALTGDKVIADLIPVVAAQAGPGSSIYQIARRAAGHGLDFMNYEGGQHLVPKGSVETPYMAALGAAQSHPGMYDLYVETIRQQKRLGSKMFCAFNSIGRQGQRFGSWGAKPDYATPLDRAPKLRALLACNS